MTKRFKKTVKDTDYLDRKVVYRTASYGVTYDELETPRYIVGIIEKEYRTVRPDYPFKSLSKAKEKCDQLQRLYPSKMKALKKLMKDFNPTIERSI